MAECYRRIIHRPAGVDDSSWSRLGELLSDAVDRQQELASNTKHVLRFEGGLQPLDDATGYFVEHEPATSLSIGGLFDPSAPALHEVQLVRVTAALFEALGAAQTAEGSGPKAHGTVCPGVILFAPDGTAKVTDFALGPAVCTALGEEAYLNLAVNPVATGSPGTYVTGSWEILAREEFTRDGRLCAFIDPQKYGAQTLSAFEPVSDVIAAAFVLHLLAEHQHPYLHDDPTAHRLVEMSEFMAMGRYNGARREDLRESTNPGVRIWCDLIGKALSRIPQNRPSPKQVVDALANHLRPEEDSDLLRHQLESVEALVGDKPWDQVRQAARDLSEKSAAPADVIQRANAIVVQAQASLLIEEAQRALDGANWPDAQTPIDAAVNMSGLPVDLAAEVRRMGELVESSLAMRVTLDEIQERLQQGEGAEPYETVELLQRQLARLEDAGGDRALVSPIEKRVSALRADLSDRLKEALPAAQAAMEADRARAEEWIRQLQSALEDQAWDVVEKLLEDRPQVRNWPEDILAQSHAVRRQLDQHRTEQERLHAIKTDEEAAQLWVDQLRLAVDAHDWERAEQLLGSKPDVAHWPEELKAQADRLVPRIRAAYEKHEAQKGAREWCERLQQTVEAGDRSAAVTLLSERPELEEWPLGALDEVAPHQRQAEQWVEDAKKEQEQLTQQNRLIQAWLDRANQASKDERWDEAVGILDAPPPLEHLPQDAQEQADKLRAFCLARTSAEAAQEFQARCDAVETVARNFVASVVSERFEGRIHADTISVSVHTEEAGLDVADADWSAEVRVGPNDGAARASEAETTFAFTFQVSDEPAQVRDDDGSLRYQLIDSLTNVLRALQNIAITEVMRPLRDGLFPQAELAASTDKPTTTMTVTVKLPDSKGDAGSVESELLWDPVGLRWSHHEPEAFVRQVLQIATDLTVDRLRRDLLDAGEELRPYRSILTLEASLGTLDDLATIPNLLVLECRVAIREGLAAGPQTLQTFPATCARVGEYDCAVDLTLTVAKLHRLVVAAQQRSADAIRSQVEDRIKAASVKAKLAVIPTRIGDPVDRLELTVKPRRQDPLVLAATWNLEKFALILPDQWENAVDHHLLTSADETQSPDGKRRKAIAAVAVLVGLVITWVAWPARPPDPLPALRVEFEALNKRVREIEGQLETPTHAQLKSLNQGGAVETLTGELHAFLDGLGENAPTLAHSAADVLDQLDGWQRNLAIYAQALDPSGLELSEQTKRLEAAQDAWPTAHVQASLARLRDVDMLDQRLDALAERLMSPTYADVQMTIEEETVEVLTADFRGFLDDLPGDATKLAVVARKAIDRLDAWQQSLPGLLDSLTPDPTKPDEPDPLLALENEWTTLDVRFRAIAETLKNPTHAELQTVNQGRTVDELSGAIRVFAQGLPEEAVELRARTREAFDQLDEWQPKLNAYAPILDLTLDLADVELSEQVMRLETARDAWPTAHVTALLDTLSKISVPYALAQRKEAEGDWRAARFFVEAASTAAQDAGFTDQLGTALRALDELLAQSRREAMVPLLDDAASWLQSAAAPVEPLELLRDVERAATARQKLDLLDLDFPTGGGDVIAAAQTQRLFPWTILTEQNKETIRGLLAWVTLSLPITGDDGTVDETIGFVFIPKASALGALDPLWMSQTEITVGQYAAVMGAWPRNVYGDAYEPMKSNDAHPVAYIPSGEVHEFCMKTAQKLGGGLIVRIPTVGEWTLALGGGRRDEGSLLDAHPRLYTYRLDGRAELDPTRVNFESDEEYAFTAPGHDDGYGYYAPVKSYPPNRWLLVDMLGNVNEWVSPAGGGKLASIGGSFRSAWTENHTDPIPRDPRRPFDDVGLRLVVLPAPE